MSEAGEMKFDIEKILNNARDYNFTISVQRAAEIIYQKTRNEITKIMKAKGGREILKKVEKELEKEGIHATFTDKILCSKCGKLISGDDNHFHRADKFYCLKCGGNKIIDDVIKMKDEQ